MIPNPFVGMGRIAWMEVRSHLRSPRLIILAAVFALAIVGASYGLAQPNPGVFRNQPQVFAHPALVNVSGVPHYRAIGWYADIYGTPVAGQELGFYSVTYNASGPPTDTLLTSATTNVSFDVGTSPPANDKGYVIRPTSTNGLGQGGVFFDPSLGNETFTVNQGQSGFSTPTSSEQIYYLHVLARDGTPATGADVYLNDTLLGHPDANGYFRVDITPGRHTVRLVFGGREQTFYAEGFPSGGPVFSSGADAVLVFLSVSLMPLLLPIVAIAVSFDTIARERVQGSLEILLSRRVRREGILVGKFLGVFLSVAFPVIAVLLAGLGVVTLVSGHAPGLPLAAAFILSGLFLVAVYVLLMLIFSTLAKSVGTAVVFGVVLWLVFNVLFNFLVFLALASVGGNVTSRSFYETLSLLYLFDPNTLFQMLVSLAIPSMTQSFSLIPPGFLGPGPVIAAGVVWIVGLFLLATFLFARKSEA
jgi:Cu-processing system permease protein